MTAQSDPYVRVYYRILDDPKFAEVYDDDAALAAWLRLLIHADALYPAPAPLPHGIKKAVLNKLVDAKLIDLGTGRRYRMHGLAAERDKRSQSGRNAAAMRWQSERNANPMHSEPNRTEPNQSAPLLNGAKPPDEEKPFVLLTAQEKAQKLQQEKEELAARTMARLGVTS